jgi:hypothetical protein
LTRARSRAQAGPAGLEWQIEGCEALQRLFEPCGRTFVPLGLEHASRRELRVGAAPLPAGTVGESRQLRERLARPRDVVVGEMDPDEQLEQRRRCGVGCYFRAHARAREAPASGAGAPTPSS